MFSTLLLGIGNFGGTEVLLISIIPILLLLALFRRLLRPSKPTVVINQAGLITSVANELRKLQQLHEQGLLNAQEYEEQKRRVLR